MKKFGIYSCLISFVFFSIIITSDTKVSSTTSSSKKNGPNSIVLVHPLVHFIDKLLSSGAFGLLLKVRKELRERLFGEPVGKSRIGMYEYNGKKYTICDLVKIEAKCDKEYETRKNSLIENKDNHDPAKLESLIVKLEKEYKEEKQLLRDVLEIAKDDFIEISKDYISSVRGTKEQLLALIKESCEKRGLKESLLLKWGETEEGHETIFLKNDVVTFKGYAKFCYDLTNFLEDLARSMPKCKRKFIDLIKKSKRGS